MLEVLVAEHAEVLFEGLCHPELYAFIDERPPASAEALRRRYERLARGRSPDGAERWLNWAVRRGEQYLGYVQATVAPAEHASIAYVLFREHWGFGYARAAALCMMALLEAEGVRRFSATVHTENARSRRLLEGLGFSLRELRPSVPAGPVDEALYGLDVTRP
ncbi:MAG: GNAT family N-acetyltransferase [Myxococcales bacterium]|nr:GNAT family N-acetyltransferase [Myxococcales bacterium]